MVPSKKQDYISNASKTTLLKYGLFPILQGIALRRIKASAFYVCFLSRSRERIEVRAALWEDGQGET
jgi:hypothetical protein